MLLEDDFEYLDTGSGRVAGKLNVFFHVAYQYYGTEETVRRDDHQWQTIPPHLVVKTAPVPFNAAAGTAFLWDDFTVRLDVDGNPLAADVTTAATIATERATQYFNYTRAAGFLRRVYAGALPFKPGSQLDGVCWRQDFREQTRGGWRTELVRGPQPPWPMVDVKVLGE